MNLTPTWTPGSLTKLPMRGKIPKFLLIYQWLERHVSNYLNAIQNETRTKLVSCLRASSKWIIIGYTDGCLELMARLSHFDGQILNLWSDSLEIMESYAAADAEAVVSIDLSPNGCCVRFFGACLFFFLLAGQCAALCEVGILTVYSVPCLHTGKHCRLHGTQLALADSMDCIVRMFKNAIVNRTAFWDAMIQLKICSKSEPSESSMILCILTEDFRLVSFSFIQTWSRL